MTAAYPPPGTPPCSFNVAALRVGSPCPTCGHTGYAHPPMSVGPCSLCLVVVEAREAITEALDRSR